MEDQAVCFIVCVVCVHAMEKTEWVVKREFLNLLNQERVYKRKGREVTARQSDLVVTN